MRRDLCLRGGEGFCCCCDVLLGKLLERKGPNLKEGNISGKGRKERLNS